MLHSLASIAAGSALAGAYYFRWQHSKQAELVRNIAGSSARPFENLGSRAADSIIALGDSRVARWAPLPVLQEPLSLIQRGIGGETLRALAERFRRDGLVCRPRAVLLQSGINDVVAASFMNEIDAKLVCVSVSLGMQRMAAESAQDGVPLLLTTLIPPGRPTGLYRVRGVDRLAELVKLVNQQLSMVTWPAGTQLLNLDPALADTSGLMLQRQFQADTLHLSANGYATLNSVVMPALAALSVGRSK